MARNHGGAVRCALRGVRAQSAATLTKYMRSYLRILDDRSGAIAIITAFGGTMLIGFAALSITAGDWYFVHRAMQQAADAAALGGAIELAHASPAATVITAAKGDAANNGFSDGSNGATVAVNNPPQSGSYRNDTSTIEVIIRQPAPMLFAGLFLSSRPTIAARAVARSTPSATACILALDPTASDALSLSQNATVPNPFCALAANSSSSSALTLRNNATVDAPVSVHGQWSLSNNAALNGSPNIENGPTVADPYANVELQAPPSCTGQQSSGGNYQTLNLSPGHFCNGWNWMNNATLNLSPGTYYIDQQLTLGNGVVINGTDGVTLVINGNYAINLGNNAQINITAPSTGPYAGLAFFGDRTGTASVQQTFPNNAVMNIKGAVYFPNQIVEFDNNAETQPGGCTQIIGRIIHLSNNVNLEENCSGAGTTPITVGGASTLAE